jgi:hypothetical protein
MGPSADFRVPKGSTKQQTLIWIDQKEEERKKNDLKQNDFKDDLLNKAVIKKIDSHINK